MGFYSRVSFRVVGLSDDEVKLVKEALEVEQFDSVTDFSGEVYGDGDIRLGGSEDENSWSERVAKRVWALIQRPVEIHASWWYERDPDETYEYDEDKFNEMFPALTQIAMTAEEKEEAN